MPSFADSIFLFVLALLLFGPKKLPVLARELGKWVGEFRRASNEFKMQMEDELRASEQADRQKQIAAMEAAAPIPPPLGEPAEPEHPHLRHQQSPAQNSILPPPSTSAEAATSPSQDLTQNSTEVFSPAADIRDSDPPPRETADGVRPIPIATSGELHMMPPATGLPTPRARGGNPLGGLLDAIPEARSPESRNLDKLHPDAPPVPEPAFAEAAGENAAHGD